MFVKNNFAGDRMCVRVEHNTPKCIGLYLKLDGYLCTNSYKYKTTTSPQYYAKSIELIKNNQQIYMAEWSIPLPDKLLPSFKSKNLSVYYEISTTKVELKRKTNYINRVSIRGNNLDCIADINLQECDETEYYKIKEDVCRELLHREFNEEPEISVEAESERGDEIFQITNNSVVKQEITNKQCNLVKKESKQNKLNLTNKRENLTEKIRNLKMKADEFKLNPLCHFKLPNIININREPQQLKIKDGDTVIAIIEIKEILEYKASFKIIYNKNISETVVNLIQQDYLENELLDAEMVVCQKFNSKNCIEKVFEFELDENSFTIKCDKFERRYVLILSLDPYEVMLDVKIASKHALIDYF